MNTVEARNTTSRVAVALIATACAVVVSACTGNTQAESPEDAETLAGVETAQTLDADVNEAPATEFGTITVGTTTYTVVESVNCELVQSSDLIDRTFEVIAVAQSASGEDVLFFAYTDEQGGVPGHFIDYQGPEGTLMTPAGNATFVLDGGNLSGAGALVDDGDTQSVMVQFDFAIPDQLAEC